MLFFAYLVAFLYSITGFSATPIDGWYSGLFVGYAYVPGNINGIHAATRYNQVTYQPGYEAGGNLGYKSNPMRYEAELTYLNANIKNFSKNNVPVSSAGGYNNAIIGMANIYYDFPGLITVLQPYLGFGIGYGWINAQLNDFSALTNTRARFTNAAFAYQPLVGLTYHFAENYSLDVGYRYIGTPNLFTFGHSFQTHIANIGIKYRFDYGKYN